MQENFNVVQTLLLLGPALIVSTSVEIEHKIFTQRREYTNFILELVLKQVIMTVFKASIWCVESVRFCDLISLGHKSH